MLKEGEICNENFELVISDCNLLLVKARVWESPKLYGYQKTLYC